MKKGLLLLLVFILIFITACSQTQIAPINKTQPVVPTCNKPYLLFNNECCLDVNSNNICDNKESEAHVSSETTIVSNDTIKITCPKEVKFSTTENPNTQVELKFKAEYTGFGNEQYKTSFYCDDGYTVYTNPINLVIDKNVPQDVKVKIPLTPKECTFGLILASNFDKAISCKIPVKAV